MKPIIVKNPLNSLQQVDIAALFGVTDRTIRNWDAEGLPGKGEGRGRVYVWAEVLAWRDTRISGSKGGDVLTDKARKEKAQADEAEIDAARKAGSVIDRAGAVRAWGAYLGRLQQNLLGYAGRVAPRLADGQTLAERQDLLDREMHASLRELVAEAKRLEEDEP